MTIDNALASIAVKDLKAAAAWYEKLFRRPADFLIPHSDFRVRTPSDAKVKTVMITDPDGNHLAFVEAIDQGMAR